MSRRRREGLSPSLFPFLAVLVCTLGTLILFLALVAQDATDAAEQNSRAKRMAEAKLQAAQAEPMTPRLTSESVESLIAAERFHVDQLVAFRDQQTANVEDRRDQLTHVEDHLERLRQKLKRLSEEVDHAMGEATLEKIEERAIKEIRARIDTERTMVEELRKASKDKTPRVVIVPHKGPNGTSRRPVYLECTDQGVTIWPEGSRLTTTQLEDADHSANPLDAALRVIRLYAMKNYGDAAPPYPLLVVRPGGIASYAAARNAMQDWDDQFGYELIPADVKLAFSKPDANLKQRVELAIRNATVQQHARHAIAQRGLGSGRGTLGSGRGNLGSGRRGKMPTLSAASLDRAGRANGFRPHQDDYAIGSLQRGRSPYTSSAPYTGNSPYNAGGRDDRFGGHSTFDGGNGNASARRWDDAMRSAAGEIRDAKLRGNSNPSGFGSGNLGSDQPGPQANQLPHPNPYATQGEGFGEANETEFTADASALNSPANGARSGGTSPSPTGGDNSTPTGGNSSRPLGESTTFTGDSQQQSQGQQSQQASSQQTAGGGGTSSSTSSSAMMSPQAGQNGSSLKNESTQSSPPKVNLDATASSKLVRRQGRDWALPPKMVGIGGNAVVRTIRVQCYQDRFVLLPPAAGGATEMFGLTNGDIDRATLQLATAVRDRIERWGASLPGGRWQPRLDVEVMPQGETRFYQMRTLMSGSGVEVTGRRSQ